MNAVGRKKLLELLPELHQAGKAGPYVWLASHLLTKGQEQAASSALESQQQEDEITEIAQDVAVMHP